MLEKELLPLLLGTGLVSALVTALFSKFSSDKNHKIENITKERKEWRDKVRTIVVEVVKSSQEKDIKKLELLEAELTVRLNPEDEHDKSIIKSLNSINRDWSNEKVKEFCDRVSYLLKHDWERAKKEATTKISSSSLMCASVAATAILTSIIFLLNGAWSDFLKSGIFLFFFFLIPAVIELLIKRKCKNSVILYFLNQVKRKEYKPPLKQRQIEPQLK